MQKEVIIDGCNVAECEWMIDGKDVIGCNSYICCCEEINNCYFKQLQRAKAENEKLKQALKKIEEIAYTTDFDIVDIQEVVDEVLK